MLLERHLKKITDIVLISRNDFFREHRIYKEPYLITPTPYAKPPLRDLQFSGLSGAIRDSGRRRVRLFT